MRRDYCSLYVLMMVRRKGELSKQGVNRGWPHQVALAADACSGRNYTITQEFCRGLSLCPRGHFFRRDDRDYVVFCFAEAAHAQLFRERFGGEPFGSDSRRRR